MKTINQPNEKTTHRMILNGFEAYCDPDTYPDVSAELAELAGEGIPEVKPFKPVSTWSKQVTDKEAKARIEKQHASLQASGVKVDSSNQLYDTGTRMAREGYEHQENAKREHDQHMSARDAAAQLADAVRSEKRKDVTISAQDLGKSLEINGKIRGAGGFALSEQAIRGLLMRLGSPALGYVLGVRDRMKETKSREHIAGDKEALISTLRHECERYGKTKLKLRTREALGDCFAIVSPSYAPADAPQVLSQIVDDLPSDAKATWSYDPSSTTWELRAAVWTPTPVEEQAVGEAFEGYVSFSSRDNGTRSFRGGGGVTLIACLNASTYVAEGRSTRRRHTGTILVDVGATLRDGTHAIRALCKAWGASRAEVIEVPKGVSIEKAIPDFYTALLTDRSSELAAVLPGRTKEHVKGLSEAFHDQRRDADRLVRADLAQGWTRYIQDQPADIRREAESAVGAWLVGQRPVRLLNVN